MKPTCHLEVGKGWGTSMGTAPRWNPVLRCCPPSDRWAREATLLSTSANTDQRNKMETELELGT